jgi:hypothetical protein
MLHETMPPEKSVQTSDRSELQEFLEAQKITSFETTLDRLTLLGDGTVDCCGQTIPCAQSFMECLAQHIQIPLDYSYRIPYDLFRHNFEERKNECSTAVKVLACDDVAINLAKPQYRPARTLDITKELSKLCNRWEFKSANLSNRGANIDLIRPGLIAVPERGDEIELGIRISNSETGFRGAKASLFSLRLVCTNGAVMSDSLGTSRWNYDRRVTYGASLGKFLADIELLETAHERQRDLYEGVTEQLILDADFLRLIRQIQLALRCDVTFVDALLGLSVVERTSMRAAVLQRPATEPAMPTSWRVWDIHNRITAGAQQMPFRHRGRLEELGGHLLNRESMN